jgi:hypothetical protein
MTHLHKGTNENKSPYARIKLGGLKSIQTSCGIITKDVYYKGVVSRKRTRFVIWEKLWRALPR